MIGGVGLTSGVLEAMTEVEVAVDVVVEQLPGVLAKSPFFIWTQ